MTVENSGIGVAKLKIIVVGDSGVGKTSLIKQYVNKKFHHPKGLTNFQEAVHVEKPVQLVDDKKTILQISEAGGKGLEVALFNNVKGCMLVYDVNNSKSLDNLDHWHNEIKCRVLSKLEDPKTFPFVVVGNKVDLASGIIRKQMLEKAQLWCQSNGPIHHILTSAKENTSIAEAFQYLAQISLEHEIKIKSTAPQDTPSTKPHPPRGPTSFLPPIPNQPHEHNANQENPKKSSELTNVVHANSPNFPSPNVYPSSQIADENTSRPPTSSGIPNKPNITPTPKKGGCCCLL